MQRAHIIYRGVEWYRSIGTEKSPGPKIYSVSGKVKRPGNYELPLGVTFAELLDLAGGLHEGRRLKGFQPGGASAPILTADHVDVPLDFDSTMEAGSMLGTAGVIVFDDTVCLVRVARYYADFFSNESCGQCTPCREGTAWKSRILRRLEEGGGTMHDLDVLRSLKRTMQGTTICLLSDASTFFVQSVLERFPEEFEAHVTAGGCPLQLEEVRSA